MKRLLITCCLITNFAIAFSQGKNNFEFTIHLDKPVQQIRNIGASGCWFSEEIGKAWPLTEKNRIAELLFSKQLDKSGQPKGIGLSAFRFNIGAGTAEQGDSSGIKDAAHRVECFLTPDGTYNWTKQPGYTWMLRQAKNYGVENLIAFVNSPPVQFTKDGLGYKLLKDGLSNLKEDKYTAYSDFLASVIKHYDHLNLHFDYISPVNEPQWDWTGKFGQAKQEGSPWQNNEIYNVVKAVDKSLSQQKLTTKILITEAGMLDHLYNKSIKNSKQIAAFWDINSPYYVGGLAHATKYVEGHGYFTENGDNYMIKTRRSLKDTLQHYGPGLEYWQSEYSMLGNGYLEGATGNRSAIDCALFLAKVIHHDFAVGNTTAWHFWNSYEPGNADHNTRYYLIALNNNRQTDTTHLYSVTKNLWALGHYSLFVRPGMYRVETERSDAATDEEAAQQVMITAFKTENNRTLVVNMINYTADDKEVQLTLKGYKNYNYLHPVKHYVTSARVGDDMKPYPTHNTVAGYSSVHLPARSINTFIFSQ
jgi:O-glycosyl hydrolase